MLFAFGVINETVLALTLLSAGSIGRTLYTGGRLIQSTVHVRERPWVALVIGVVPVLGNFAYPLQIVYSSTESADDLAIRHKRTFDSRMAPIVQTDSDHAKRLSSTVEFTEHGKTTLR